MNRWLASNRLRRYFRDLWQLGITLLVATVVGQTFLQIGVPAPFLLGSMFGVWLLGALNKPLRSYLKVPRWFHISVVLGLGVLVGAMFGPEIFEQAITWAVTLSGMLIATIIATLVGYLYLTRWRGYDRSLAMFCAIPGGQAEVIVLSRDLVDKDYVVALCHLVRVVVVFCSVPLVLALTMGESAVRDSNLQLAALPSWNELPNAVLFQFVAIALVGFSVARLIRMPVPYLTGPLFLSITLHLAGLVHIPRINEFVFLAQVTIGGAVGARLAQVDLAELAVYLKDALVVVLLLLSVFVVAAGLVSALVGLPFFDVMLAFVPGGLYEVTLLSFVFGFDVAFVALHHGFRMLFILFSLPWVLKWLKKGEQ